MFSNNDVFEQWLDTEANSVLEKLKDLRENSSLQLQEFRIEQNKKWDETNKNIHKLYEAMNFL